MTRIGEDSDLERRLDALAAQQPPVMPDTAAIAGVVETMLRSLTGDVSIATVKLYRELEELAEVIQSARRDIVEIQPHDIREHQIPMATDELDAVVGATEQATGTILAACETIERQATTASADVAAVLGAEVTRIYEACNFQDITGQRITKVVATLKQIETRIDVLLAAFGDDIPKVAAARAPADDEMASLMSGPQLPGKANSQDDIDAILASFD